MFNTINNEFAKAQFIEMVTEELPMHMRCIKEYVARAASTYSHHVFMDYSLDVE